MNGARVERAHYFHARIKIVQISTVSGRFNPKLDDLRATFDGASVHHTIADNASHVIKAVDEAHDSGRALMFIFLRPLAADEFTEKGGNWKIKHEKQGRVMVLIVIPKWCYVLVPCQV